MGISPLVAQRLRQHGHDAVHLRDQGLKTLPDDEVLEKARTEGRILLTMDLDFGQLMASSQGSLPTVVTFRLDDESADNVSRRLSAVLAHHTQDLEKGALLSVSEWAIRVRDLPL